MAKSSTIRHEYKNPGIYINDNDAPFTKWILNGAKTIETRNRDTLGNLVGRRVAIVRTKRKKVPMVVGYADIVDKVVFHSEYEFNLAQDLHKVPVFSSIHDFNRKKVGYLLANVESVKPFVPTGTFSTRSCIDIVENV